MAGTNIEAVVTSTLKARETDSNGLILSATCTGTPPTTADIFQHGAVIMQTDTASAAKSNFENTGTSALPVWNLMGDATVGEITLATGSILIGAAGVGAALDVKTTGRILVGNGTTATSVALSGDATLISTGAITVVSANAAFNIGTNETWTKEVNHSSTVSSSTTATVAGGNLTMTAGLGNTSGVGGNVAVNGGNGGNVAAGGNATVQAGNAGGGNAVGGAASVTGGSGAGTSAGGGATVQSGTSANGAGVSPGASGAVNITVGAAGTATTGTGGAGGALNVTGAAGGNSTGAGSTSGAGTDVTISAGKGGDSSGGGDTGGAGGDVVLVAGAGGTGATAGNAGAVFSRASSGAGYLVKMPAPTAKTTSVTLTAAEILSGWITVNQGGGASSTQTTPTGTAIAAAFPATLAAGDCFDFFIINISANAAEDAVLGAGADVSIVGNATVNSNDGIATQSQGMFRFRYSGANVWVAYRAS